MPVASYGAGMWVSPRTSARSGCVPSAGWRVRVLAPGAGCRCPPRIRPSARPPVRASAVGALRRDSGVAGVTGSVAGCEAGQDCSATKGFLCLLGEPHLVEQARKREPLLSRPPICPDSREAADGADQVRPRCFRIIANPGDAPQQRAGGSRNEMKLGGISENRRRLALSSFDVADREVGACEGHLVVQDVRHICVREGEQRSAPVPQLLECFFSLKKCLALQQEDPQLGAESGLESRVLDVGEQGQRPPGQAESLVQLPPDLARNDGGVPVGRGSRCRRVGGFCSRDRSATQMQRPIDVAGLIRGSGQVRLTS